MPNRSVGRYLAAAVALYLVWLRHKPKRDQDSRSSRRADESKREQPWPDTFRVHVGNEGWPPDDSRHKRNEAKYWIASIAVSVVGTVAAITAAIYAGGAFKASSDQAVIASQTLLENSRPWLTVDGIFDKGSVSISDGYIYVTGEVGLRNIGHSLAQNLRIYDEVIALPAEQYKAQIFCRSSGNNLPEKPVEADAIFPDNALIRRFVGARIKREAFIKKDIVAGDRLFQEIGPLIKRKLPDIIILPQSIENHIVKSIGIIGCIDYKTSADNFQNVHRSSFEFYLSRKPRNAAGDSPAFDFSKDRDWPSAALDTRVSPTPLYAD